MSNYKYATIKVYYKDKIFESIKLDISVKENSETIYGLSTFGTTDLPMLKFPTSETSEVIISKYQLDESVIEIQLFEAKKTRTKKIESVVG